MPKTSFSPAANGFLFANRFTNYILKLPILGTIATAGRCGGMAYAALDCYFSGVSIPLQGEKDFMSTGGVPPDGTPLADYIYRRQIDSFLVFSAVKFVLWALTPDQPSLFRRGVSHWTKEHEFPKLRKAIDANTPVPLALVVAKDLSGLALNHQVVAYDYDYDPATEKMTVYIYDSNHPGEEVTLFSDKTMIHFQQSTGEKWRGWFVQDYLPQRPPPAVFPELIGKALSSMASEAAPFARRRPGHVTVQFDTVTIHTDENPNGTDKISLMFNVNGKTARWPRSGLCSVRAGRTYVVKKLFAVDLTPDDTLSISVNGVDPEVADLPVLDMDGSAAIMSKTFTRAERWGKGRHKDRSLGHAGGYTIYYTIK